MPPRMRRRITTAKREEIEKEQKLLDSTIVRPFETLEGLPVSYNPPADGHYEDVLKNPLTIKDSAVLYNSLIRSRNTYVQHAPMFKLYWVKQTAYAKKLAEMEKIKEAPRERESRRRFAKATASSLESKTRIPVLKTDVNARDVMSKLCESSVTLGPHSMEIRIFIAKDARSEKSRAFAELSRVSEYEPAPSQPVPAPAGSPPGMAPPGPGAPPNSASAPPCPAYPASGAAPVPNQAPGLSIGPGSAPSQTPAAGSPPAPGLSGSPAPAPTTASQPAPAASNSDSSGRPPSAPTGPSVTASNSPNGEKTPNLSSTSNSDVNAKAEENGSKAKTADQLPEIKTESAKEPKPSSSAESKDTKTRPQPSSASDPSTTAPTAAPTAPTAPTPASKPSNTASSPAGVTPPTGSNTATPATNAGAPGTGAPAPGSNPPSQPQPTSQPPPPPPPAANLQSIDNLIMISNLNAIAKIDLSLNDLMKVVALGAASEAQITHFKKYIERAKQMGPQPHHADLYFSRNIPLPPNFPRPRPYVERRPPKPRIPNPLKLTAFQEKYLHNATLVFEFLENPNVRYVIPKDSICEVLEAENPPKDSDEEAGFKDILLSHVWIHNTDEVEAYEKKLAEYNAEIRKKQEEEEKRKKELEEAEKNGTPVDTTPSAAEERNLRTKKRAPPPKKKKPLEKPEEPPIRFTTFSFTLHNIPLRFVPIVLNSMKPLDYVQTRMSHILKTGTRVNSFYLWYQVDARLDEGLAEYLRYTAVQEEKKMQGIMAQGSMVEPKKRKPREFKNPRTKKPKDGTPTYAPVSLSLGQPVKLEAVTN